MKGLDVDDDAQQPDLSWSEPDLRKFLAAAWDEKSPSHIQVIGRLRLVDGSPFAFLEDLHHPSTGMKLPAPSPHSKVQQGVFVPPAELKRVMERHGEKQFARAALDLSPLPKRSERNDPLACTVRAGTLTPLSQLPAGWGISKIDSESVPLIVDMAREAIEARLNEETAGANTAWEAARASLDATRSEHAALDQAMARISNDIQDEAARLDTLEAEAANRRLILEIKLRELETLVKEKGDRMLALKLIEPSDMERLFPTKERERERLGHDFQTAFGGDLKSLASYVQAHLWQKGLHYSRAQLLDFITLLRTNDLVILAGDSGSGKTSLAKSVAEAIGGQCTVIPVKPNWTSSDDLLGYYNPIEGRYHPTRFLLALLEAANDPEVPHFICLDEMNLARVEYYFADFLSLLETRGSEPWIHLYGSADERQTAADNRLFLTLEAEARNRAGLKSDASLEDILLNDEANQALRNLVGFQESDTVLAHHAKLRRSLASLIEIPPVFRYPRNVWIVGAINVDETTHYLSPKILDRAHVMRFRNPVLVDWDVISGEVEEFELDLTLPVRLRAADLGQRAEYPKFDPEDARVKLLIDLSRRYLDPLGIEFGLRAIRQAVNYLEMAGQAGLDATAALNNVVLHKILPKVVIELDKTAPSGAPRRELLVALRDALAEALEGLDTAKVTESSVDALEHVLSRADSNNGIANFWAR